MSSRYSTDSIEHTNQFSGEHVSVQSINALGLILTCIDRSCRFRAWKEQSDVPAHVTVPMLEKLGRCGHCGHRGASVEVVQKVWVMSSNPSDWEAVNAPHRRRMREYINAHPFQKGGDAI